MTFVDFHPPQLAGEATAVSRARELLRDMENEVAASRRNLQALRCQLWNAVEYDVDGKNPVDMVNITLFTGFLYITGG